MEHWKAGDIRWEKAPSEYFTGEVLFGPIRHDGSLNVLAVGFAPGARTDWHYHPGGQVLYVTEGAGLVQDEGGDAVEIAPGDVIYTPPDRVHWHGALPHSPMTHYSHTTGDNTVWEPRKVTEEEYRLAESQARQEGRSAPASGPADQSYFNQSSGPADEDAEE